MPCYNYTSNDPIYFEPNIGIWSVERVYSVGQTYSYAAIARMCEIPDKDQLCVYTRAGVGSPETKLTLNINYTVNTSNETIVLINPPASGQVVVRRCTSNTKMLTTFSEGAKLTAQQLNLSTYQLLFLLQEKEFVGTTINEFYPIAITASAWSGATAYVVNNYVLSGGNIYRCIANNTNFQPPNATYWTLVNQASNGFVIEGGAGLSGPLKFNLNNITNGAGLIWNGSQFEAGFITTTLDNLSDVVITNPSNNHILRYNGTTSTWINALPTVDITLANPVFNSHIFVDEVTSYTNNNTSIPSSYAVPALNRFRDLNNKWNIPSILTTYHMLNVLTPGYTPGTSSTYFENFLSYINTTVNQFAGAIANPVKVKLHWNLNKARLNAIDAATSDNLQDYRSTFWDKPEELYHVNMWTLVSNLQYHGVLTSTANTYWQNPYFYKEDSTFNSKITGYGIQNYGFYLSVPECYTTSLARIPIIKNTPTTWTDHIFIQAADVNNIKLTSCNENSAIYRDLYLEGLRDMMCAASIPNQTNYTSNTTAAALGTVTLEEADRKARFAKGNILHADYNGLVDISYKRLETSEGAKSCLFKIPKQIIYYNKSALAWASTSGSLTTADTPTATWPNMDGDITSSGILSAQTAFTGPGKVKYPATANINSTTTNPGGTKIGSLYKADEFWNRWCSSWSTNSSEYYFNEADIEWQLKEIVSGGGTSVGLFNYQDRPMLSISNLTTGNHIPASKQYPWPYRSLYYDKLSAYADGFIGNHIFNVDINKFFSESLNYLPDPRDEYVFRLVVNRNLLSTFKKATSVDIASSIIVEHGFTDEQDNGLTSTAKTLASSIYQKNNVISDSHRARLRFNRNDIKVYVQNEHLESYDGDPTHLQYVITLCISVPRLKSIGYSRIFRAPLTTTITTPLSNAGDPDTDKNLGPWSFYFDNLTRKVEADTINNVPTFYNLDITLNSANNFTTLLTDNEGVFTNTSTYNAGTTGYFLNEYSYIGGRNECAVKFTRLGIPSDLWIKVSVLNTDASLSLLNSSGGWNI